MTHSSSNFRMDDLGNILQIMKVMRQGVDPEALLKSVNEAEEKRINAQFRETIVDLVSRKNEAEGLITPLLERAATIEPIEPNQELAKDLQKQVTRLQIIQEQSLSILSASENKLREKQQHSIDLTNQLTSLRQTLEKQSSQGNRTLHKCIEAGSELISDYVQQGEL